MKRFGIPLTMAALSAVMMLPVAAEAQRGRGRDGDRGPRVTETSGHRGSADRGRGHRGNDGARNDRRDHRSDFRNDRRNDERGFRRDHRGTQVRYVDRGRGRHVVVRPNHRPAVRPVVRPQVIRYAPPARRFEHRPNRRPYRGAVWVEGRWAWNGYQYVWQNGYWTRPRNGHRFIQGRWERRGGTWAYVDGRWARF